MGSKAVLLAELLSPPPEIVAELVSLAGAAGETLTVIVMGGKLAPAAKVSERVQVSVARSADQPAPLIAVAVSPAGRLSVTVRFPTEAVMPRLVTEMVKVS